MPRKSEQEWMIIENDYITNPVTYADLEAKYHITREAVCHRFMKKGILLKRENYINQSKMKIEEGNIKTKQEQDYNLINQLEELVKQKTTAELLALKRYYSLAGDSISPKDLMTLINKSKDSNAELIRMIELLKGNATDRVEFDDKEKEARSHRLNVLGFN